MNCRALLHLRLVAVPFVALGIASTSVQAASGDPKYRLTDVGSLAPCGDEDVLGTAINSKGQIIGTSCYPVGGRHGFLWKDDGTLMVNLGLVNPIALNDSGQVTGEFQSGGVTKAFLWKNDGTPTQTLSTLGGALAQGLAINNAGQIAGSARKGPGGPIHAVVWRNGGQIEDLGTLGGTSSETRAQNQSGQVTGFSGISSNARRAFIWKNDGTPMQNLGTLGGTRSEGHFINAKGQVAGTSTLRNGQTHAFLWRNDGRPMVDVGTLGGSYSFAYAVNDSGWIAGTSGIAGDLDQHGFVWRNDGKPMLDIGGAGAFAMNNLGWVVGDDGRLATFWKPDGKGSRNLNDLIDPADPQRPFVVLLTGLGINDAGDIMAFGCDTRIGCRTYLARGSLLALDPHSLAFGRQQVGTTSASASIAVLNRSLSPVPITSIALRGTDASQFPRTSNCGNRLAAKGTCTIRVTFKPSLYGAQSATLLVNGSGGGLRVVKLTGTGS